MIPRSATIPKTPSWQQQMARSFTRLSTLLEWLDIDGAELPFRCDDSSSFPLRVTLDFASRMRMGDAGDPLLLQVLPQQQESAVVDGYSQDPVGDMNAAVSQGILQKYNGRALLITTAVCAIHCRYCFRRHFPYQQQHLEQQLCDQTLEKLNVPDISEIILSGGDPLTLNDQRLAQLLLQLKQLPYLKRLRIHTRMPVILPSRVTPELVEMLRNFPLPVTTVLHINHPNELDKSVATALHQLRQSDTHILNQAVLLKGINDSSEILKELCEKGFDMGILPYYVHQLDKVHGSAHFQVSRERALELEEQLRKQLPGYLLPKFVTEIEGK
ncbi:MAG: EF-P beta-lysylation protein EpmB, partial [Gammaproteobacteria bacterium]|nr:EF-P beta-lysylation protein EpmB [Gammaproteobacteria bacterium]